MSYVVRNAFPVDVVSVSGRVVCIDVCGLLLECRWPWLLAVWWCALVEVPIGVAGGITTTVVQL